MIPPVGIDLGTTYSVVAVVDNTGRPTSLPTSSGELLLPSAVYIDNEDLIVGREALKSGIYAPDNFAECFKRDMGRPYCRRLLCGRQIPPEVLSALVLRRLKQEAARHLGDVRQAVVTVPAYFDELRRKATQDAARLAGWDVLDIINEPTAAALAYGYEQGRFGVEQPPNRSEFDQHVLVYDLGGGTFDVSLLHLEGTRFRTLAIDGDVELGGRDFDERLVNYLANEFAAAHGADPRSDPRDAAQLWREAEDAKRTLSERSKAVVVILHAGVRMRIEITREKFEHLTADLLERTRDTVDLLVRRAGYDWKQIDCVLLMGGASRMPMINNMLRTLTGQDPKLSSAPDEAVAHGAAIFAALLQNRNLAGPMRTCELINVNAHSLGLVGIHHASHRRVTGVMIPRNTPIPTEAVRTFRTLKFGQRNVSVPVVEGECEHPDYNVRLGQCVVRNLPPDLPQGTPVEVRYRYGANGRLFVSARIPSTGQLASVEIERGAHLPPIDLATWELVLRGKAELPSEEPAASSASEPSTPAEVRIEPGREEPSPGEPVDLSASADLDFEDPQPVEKKPVIEQPKVESRAQQSAPPEPEKVEPDKEVSVEAPLADEEPVAAPPDASPKTPSSSGPTVRESDVSAAIRRLDDLYLRIGQAALMLRLPDALVRSQRAALLAVDTLDTAENALATAEREQGRGGGQSVSAIRENAQVAQARLAVQQARVRANFSQIVLGRECVNQGFQIEECQAEIESAIRLRQELV